MVDVSTGSTGGSITVTGGSITPSITATSDTTQYWSNQSKSWAEKSEESAKKAEQAKEEVITQKDLVIGEVTAEGEKQKGILETTAQSYVDEAENWANKLGDTVDGVEYSAKYYAELTADRAETAVTDIDNAKTTSLSEINTTKTQSLDEITTLKNGAVSTINTGITNINNTKNAAITAVQTEGAAQIQEIENLSETIKTNVAVLGKETDEVLTDTTVLADIRKYAHSTFDLSKFAAVGSPTITNDGIASGFSESTGISCITSIAATFKTLTVKGRAVYAENSTTKAQQMYNTSNSFRGEISAGRNNCTFFPGFGATGALSIDVSSEKIKTNDVIDYTCSLNVETKTLTAAVIINGNRKYTRAKTYDTLTVNSSTTVTVSAASYPWYGSIDLKHFSITVDGVEVFSGNKTGIDIIKPDNYEVVGSPTITDDGIASGFSNENYIKASQTLDLSKPFNIKFSARFKSNSTVQQVFVSFNDTGWRNYILDDKTRLTVFAEFEDGSLYDFRCMGLSSSETFYHIEFSWDGETYKLKYSMDGQAWTESVYSSTLSLKGFNNINTIGLGKMIAQNYYPLINGSIDLNSLKIYVDGNLVYQPCLEIPYTLSKTGSKIVQSIYRDRVQDVYEQEGYAPYYTLGESDFTLPMGEIYGMIDKKVDKNALDTKQDKCIYITETYQNGSSGYRIWSDGYCEQWGRIPSGTTSQEVTFLKRFNSNIYNTLVTDLEDTDDTSGIGECTLVSGLNPYYLGQKEDGFRISKVAKREINWKASGYLAEGEY